MNHHILSAIAQIFRGFRFPVLAGAGLAVLGASGCRLPSDWTPDGPVRTLEGGVTVRKAILPEQRAETLERLSDLNDVSRYLAGMPGGQGSPLNEDRHSAHWQQHRANMNELWRQFSEYRQPRMAEFSGKELGGLRNQETVFYPFSGPDILFPMAFFPGSRNFLLCGLEGGELLPDLTALGAGERQAGLDGVYTSLTTALNCSFFITKDMRVDLQRTRLQGTLPIELVFLARQGMDIQSVVPVHVTGAGTVAPGTGDGRCPGYQVRCRAGWGSAINVYYFKENLANDNLASDSRYLRFVASFGGVATYLKSASYLMHSGEFSRIRGAILDQSVAVLEDDSGIPIRYFPSDRWDMHYYGNYTGVLDIFSEYYQTDLMDAYSHIPAANRQLDFGLGYRYEAGKSALILARRRS